MAVYKTVQREILLDFLKARKNEAFTVREIAYELSRRGDLEKIPSESTVYRLLKDLEKNGSVQKDINPENREFVYRLTENHGKGVSMRCRVCGNVYSVDNETSRRLQADIAGVGDIVPDGDIEFIVECRNCKHRPEEQNN
ncbi:MAG: transcriptional repressor [Ruminiclostridium sp.]|nr:transcriptional repressor [Ruminiclostridium sp.]